jgi:dipeptide/tripeptide permease
LVTGVVLAGLSVIGIGALLIVVGLVLLVKAILAAEKSLRVQAAGVEKKGVLGDAADLVKALNELIKAVGVARGVPLAVMILGLVLIVIGTGMLAASG